MRPNCADMARNRVIYLAVLLGCGIFYIAYGQWLAWLLLVAVAGAPWLSLALSLPAMLNFRIQPAGKELLTMGDSAKFWLLGSCAYPAPPFRGRLVLQRAISGETLPYREDTEAVTTHCGSMVISVKGVRVCDYLGLFSMPVWKKEALTILVRPQPVPAALPKDLHRQISLRWKPKPGGGFAENHELRLYRPGDSLGQVHWKLSAKTGTRILREPVEPLQGQVLLTMHLRGRPEETDRKFGRLLWLGNYLLEQQVPFELRVLTAEGILTFPVSEQTQLQHTIDTLLCQRAAAQGDIREQGFSAPWHCHIGGEPDAE